MQTRANKFSECDRLLKRHYPLVHADLWHTAICQFEHFKTVKRGQIYLVNPRDFANNNSGPRAASQLKFARGACVRRAPIGATLQAVQSGIQSSKWTGQGVEETRGASEVFVSELSTRNGAPTQKVSSK